MILSQRFDDWLSEQEDALQEKVLADPGKLKMYGPDMPRPYADTIKGSQYKNMVWWERNCKMRHLIFLNWI